jgi:hypothetical protein
MSAKVRRCSWPRHRWDERLGRRDTFVRWCKALLDSSGSP